MRDEIVYMLGLVAVGFAVNYALRALPFLLFAGRDRKLPKWIERFGDLVSPAIIAVLVVYSFASLKWRSPLPYAVGALVVELQLWRRNALFSIVAGTIVYMGLLCTGCSTTPPLALDAEHPSIRYSSQGFLVGDRFVDPRAVPRMLESNGVPRERTIHILVEEDAERNLRPARAFMGLLGHHGYRRCVLVTKRHDESESGFLEISVARDGIHVGPHRELMLPSQVAERLRARGVPAESTITVFLEDRAANHRADTLARQLRQSGYRLVDVIEKHYSDLHVFRQTRAGLRYGAHVVSTVDEALALLAANGADKAARVIVYVDSDCSDKPRLRVVKALLDRLAAAGYANVEKAWTPEGRSSPGGGQGARGSMGR